MISNTDDHLRHHGFLSSGESGWRLSPAYDLNPIPLVIRPRVLSTNVNEHDGTASIGLAMEVAELFEFKEDEARTVLEEVGRSVSQWRKGAEKLGIAAREVVRMASAIEHSDLRKVISPRAGPRIGRQKRRQPRFLDPFFGSTPTILNARIAVERIIENITLYLRPPYVHSKVHSKTSHNSQSEAILDWHTRNYDVR